MDKLREYLEECAQWPPMEAEAEKALSLLTEAEKEQKEIIEGMSAAAGELLNKKDAELAALREKVREWALGLENAEDEYVADEIAKEMRQEVNNGKTA